MLNSVNACLRLPLSMVMITLLCLVASQSGLANELPQLGDSASGTVAPDVEHRLGRAWLRVLRSRAPMISDPLVKDYTKHIIYKLAENSQLEDRRLEIAIVDSPQLNAFAVPGGIIGVNAGMFLYAHTEQEFSSVMAHELAHLSQRHYSRNVESAKRNTLPSLAALLVSVAIAATAGGDAGMAAIAATQGFFMDKQLRFSRQNEQEADRVGLSTMVASGMDPNAMASMFERMLASQRLAGSRPPEFLLSHPLTDSRVSDARARARTYPPAKFDENIEYYLMRNRIKLGYADSPVESIKQFSSDLDSPDPLVAKSARYALALALNAANRSDEANRTLLPLLQENPNRISFLVAYSEINREPHRLGEMQGLLGKHLSLNPNNYPLSMELAKNLALQERFGEAAKILTQLSASRPNEPEIWYELAEIQGKHGDIVGVHLARAEYFISTGRLDTATEQLGFAANKVGVGNYPLRAKIEQRLVDVRNYKEELEQF